MRRAPLLALCVVLSTASMADALEDSASVVLPALTPEAQQKIEATQAAADLALAKQAAYQKVVTAAQAKVKAANQAIAKAKADELRLTSELAPLKKAVEEKTAAVAELNPKVDAALQARQSADAVLETEKQAKTSADEALVAATDLAKAAEETAAAARIAADKSPNNASLAALRTQAEQVAAEIVAAMKTAEGVAATAAQKVTDAETAAKAATDAHVALVAQLDAANAALKAANDAFTPVSEKLTASLAAVQTANESLSVAKTEVDQKTAELNDVTAECTAALKAAEEALAAVGRHVSFASQVAPIFAKRCVSCHNAQMAKGRYNMDSYLGVLKGGEQGDTVLPRDGEGSRLVELMLNGEMPKDGDPVPATEIALVKQWIDNGARLDAGLKAESLLTQIMPKPTAPPAPESYRVALPVTAVAWSPDGGIVATSGYNEILLWNPNDKSLLRRIGNIAERTYDIEFSPDGKLVAVAAGTPGQMGEVKLLNPADGSLVKDLATTSDAMFSVAFSADGRRLAASGADRTIRLFDVETGAQQKVIEDHADWVLDVAWSPDGSRIASASRDKTSKLFDANTGDSIITFSGHSEVVYSVCFAPDGASVFTSGRDNRVRQWNPDANAAQIREIGGFGGEVYKVTVSADGRLFATGADKVVREFKAADGAAVRNFEGNRDWVYTVAFHPATNRVVSGCWDGEVRIWNSEDAAALNNYVAAPGLETDAQANAAAK